MTSSAAEFRRREEADKQAAQGRNAYQNALANTVYGNMAYEQGVQPYRNALANTVYGSMVPAQTPATPPRPVTGGGISRNFSAQNNAARAQMLQARLDYLNRLSPMQESLRQARVGEAEAAEQAGSALAMSRLGGAVPASSMQRILDSFRAQQAQIGGQKMGLREALERRNLQIRQEQANAIAREALRRAQARAAAIQREAARELEQAGFTATGGR